MVRVEFILSDGTQGVIVYFGLILFIAFDVLWENYFSANVSFVV